jgi:hypothetical protein
MACVISGLDRGVNEIFDFLGCYSAYVTSTLPAFFDNLSVQSSMVKHSHWNA